VTTRVGQLKLSVTAEPAPCRFQLQILIDPFAGSPVSRTVEVCGELTIGRDPSADLTLQGRLVSRRHALVRAFRDGLEIEDISTHGTLVDRVALRLARLRVGPECSLFVGCSRVWLRRMYASESGERPL